MATYNGAAFVHEQLESFVRQTRLPDELVVTDDASSDETVTIVERFATVAPFRVSIHRNPQRLGYTTNFSKAVSLCAGDVIFISDQDDRWLESKVERIMAVVEGGAPVALNDQTIVNADGIASGTVLHNMRRLGFSDRHFVAGSCIAMTSSFAALALPFPKDFPYDSWIGRLADSLEIKSILDEPLQIYRRHERNTTDSVFAQDKPSKFGLLRRYGLSDARAAWTNQIQFLDACQKRIEERRQMAESLSTCPAVAAAIAEINKEREIYARRLQAILPHPLKRAPLIMKMWKSGDYSHFAGWKSAIRDLIRP